MIRNCPNLETGHGGDICDVPSWVAKDARPGRNVTERWEIGAACL
jgi:hypothetical protein